MDREGNKLQRFVETYSVAAKYCEHINSTPELRERYREAISRVTDNPGFQKLTEKATADGEEIDLYRFPVSRINDLKPNQNGRKYTRKLWERVIRDQQSEWKGRVGLADHPPEDSDGEFKNAAIVWLDMEIDDANGLVWAVGTFVGNFGALAKDIISKGGRIGFSSSGFGELMSDRTTVDPDTYVLERCADIVLNPSQDVFGEAGDALNVEYSRQEPIKGASVQHEASIRPKHETGVEQVACRSCGKMIDEDYDNCPYCGKSNIGNKKPKQHESVRIKENRMDQNDAVLTEGTVKSAPISKQEEKKFRRDISRYLEDADKMESPQARLAELTDILGFFEDGAAPDLRKMVEDKILAEKASLEQMAEEAQRVQETFGVENNEQLKIGVALLAEEVKVATAEAKDWEKISLAMRENNAKLRESLQAAQVELAKRPTSKVLEDANARVTFLEAQRRRQLFAYNEEVKALEAQLAESNKKVEVSSKKFEEATQTILRKANEMKALEERLNVAEKIAADRKNLVESIGKEKNGYESVMNEAELTIDRLTGQVARLQGALKESQEDYAALNAQFDKFKEDLAKANTPNMLPKFSERAKGFLNFDEQGGAAVEGYWADLVSRYGESIVPYERQIRGQKTYREAYSQFLKIQSLIDESARAVNASRLPESIAIPKAERLEALEEAGMKFGEEKGVLERNSSWAK